MEIQHGNTAVKNKASNFSINGKQKGLPEDYNPLKLVTFLSSIHNILNLWDTFVFEIDVVKYHVEIP